MREFELIKNKIWGDEVFSSEYAYHNIGTVVGARVMEYVYINTDLIVRNNTWHLGGTYIMDYLWYIAEGHSWVDELRNRIRNKFVNLGLDPPHA